jgi:hypothetical protein
MARLIHLFTAAELKAIGPKGRAALQREATKHVRTAPEIHKVISSHPKVRQLMKTKPHAKFRKSMRTKLNATFNKLKRQHGK